MRATHKIRLIALTIISICILSFCIMIIPKEKEGFITARGRQLRRHTNRILTSLPTMPALPSLIPLPRFLRMRLSF